MAWLPDQEDRAGRNSITVMLRATGKPRNSLGRAKLGYGSHLITPTAPTGNDRMNGFSL
jgi:hypothetical protein